MVGHGPIPDEGRHPGLHEVDGRDDAVRPRPGGILAFPIDSSTMTGVRLAETPGLI